jgi:Zn-finger nucleic acid-binding protein
MNATMQCPKCPAKLETVERHGIVIEICEGCQGVYLDRGELEQIIDAESEYLATLPTSENPETIYQGKHRSGIMHQIFSGEH